MALFEHLNLTDGAVLVGKNVEYTLSIRYDDKYKIGIATGEYMVLVNNKTKTEIMLNWVNKEILNSLRNKETK